jgi:PAS domain S-box-containing protein
MQEAYDGELGGSIGAYPRGDTERWLRLVLDNLKDVIFLVDTQCRLLYVSPSCYQITGWTQEELYAGPPVIDEPDLYIFKEDQPRFLELWQRALGGAPAQDQEIRAVRKDGRVVWLSLSWSPVMNERGEVLAVQGSIRDVTSRKLFDEALKESEERYRGIFNSAVDGVLIVDMNGSVLDANPAYCALVGYSHSEILRKSAFDVVMPDDREEVYKHLRSVAGGKKVAFECVEVKKDGTIFPIEARGIPFTYGGKPAFLALIRDITDRKRADYELRRLTDELEATVRAFPDIHFRLTSDGTIIGYKADTEAELYMPPREFLGKRMQDVLPPDVGQLFENALNELQSMHSLVSIEYGLPVQGRDEDYEARLVPMPGDEALVIVRQITQRKTAEEALRMSEERYRLLFESNPHPMWVYSLKTLRFLAVNNAAVAHYGYSRKEFLSMTIKDIRPPEDVPALLQHIVHMAEGMGLSGIWRHRKKDGSIIDVEITSHTLDFDGEHAKLVLANDITERKIAADALTASESKYRELVEDLTDWVWELDLTGTFTYASPAVEKMLGYTPEEVVGRNAIDLIVEEEREQSIAFFREVIEEARGYSAMLHGSRHKDGSIRYVETTGSPVFDARGQLIGYRGVDRDVTDRATAEEEKRRFYKTAILAFTSGKLEIVSPDEALALSTPTEVEISVKAPEEVGHARHEIRDALIRLGLSGERLDSFITAVGEAINNVVKHAGGGKISAGARDGLLWVSVSDTGAGIEHLSLPRAILEKGFSTKPSLGLGYSIMLNAADRLALATGPAGTHVILEKNLKPKREPGPLDLIADTW